MEGVKGSLKVDSCGPSYQWCDVVASLAPLESSVLSVHDVSAQFGIKPT